jgi:hypothetical protein
MSNPPLPKLPNTGANRLTQARLKELLRYEPETGHFFWRVAKARRIQIGDRAGSNSGNGYQCIVIDGSSHRAHRLAWLYVHGRFPNGQLDHKNRNPSSCRIADLREATNCQNHANSRTRRDNRSGLKGVQQRGYRWIANIQHKGKRTCLGTFDSPEQAHAAYSAVAKDLYGEFFYSGGQDESSLRAIDLTDQTFDQLTAGVVSSSTLERAAYTIPEFCFRNNISRPTYHRLRAEGRGPVEMRVGLNLIGITAQAERDWQRQLQRPSADLERRARARAVRAGDAAVKSDKHISVAKRRAAR